MKTLTLFSSNPRQYLILAVVALLSVTSCGKNPVSGPNASSSYMEASLEVSDVRFGSTAMEFAPDRIVIWGKVTNTGDLAVDHTFTLTMAVHDENGRVIDTGSKGFSGIQAGQTLSFEILADGIQAGQNAPFTAESQRTQRPVLADSEASDTRQYDQIAEWSVAFK